MEEINMTEMSIDEFNRLCEESIPEKEKQYIKGLQDILKKDPMINAALNNQTSLYIDECFKSILEEIKYDKQSETKEV